MQQLRLRLAKDQQKTSSRWSWQLAAPLPYAVTAASAAVVDGHLYIMGGLDSHGETLTRVSVYDPEKNTWAEGPPLPAGRHHAAAVTVQGTIYFMGGYRGVNFIPEADVFIYDPTREQWESGIPLPQARAAHAAAALDGDIYVLGGVTGKGVSADLLCFHITELGAEIPRRREREWDQLASMTMPREHTLACMIGSSLVVVGGHHGVVNTSTAALEWFNVSGHVHGKNTLQPTKIRSWVIGPPLPTPRGGAAGVYVNGLLIVSGGEQVHGAIGNVEAYDVWHGRWLQLPPLRLPRHDSACAAIAGRIYVVGGGQGVGLSMSTSCQVLDLAG